MAESPLTSLTSPAGSERARGRLPKRSFARPSARLAACAVAAVALAGCSESGTPTAPAAATLLSCVYGPAGSLELGEAVQARAGEQRSVCLQAPPDASGEYLLVPFHASSGASNASVKVSGGGSQAPMSQVPGAEGAEASGPGGTEAPDAAGSRGRASGVGVAGLENGLALDWAFHLALREREARELAPRIPAARAAVRRAARLGDRPGHGFPPPALSASGSAAADPAEGDLLQLNTTARCGTMDLRTGRVEAVGQRSIVVADTLNPAGGFTAADWQHFAATFDTLVHPVNTEHFGERTDLDANGRTILFFTRAVNELTPPGSGVFIAGFFWAGDLFPQSDLSGLPGCPGSNFGEIFYLFVPDPTGEAGIRHQTDFVRRVAVGVVGHEDQHLINAARRIYISDATAFEDTWLNEALSHTAEELLFYATTPFAPGQNLGPAELFADQTISNRFASFAALNLVNYGTYLNNVTQESPLGLDRLATRGAAWSFLRYLADHQDRPQPVFFRDLVDGPLAGLDNLEDALGEDPLGPMQDWTVAAYADDLVPELEPRFTNPSWNYRAVLDAIAASGFALPVANLRPDTPSQLTIRGGSAAYVRFGLAAGARGLVELGSTDDGPPPVQIRYSLLRVR